MTTAKLNPLSRPAAAPGLCACLDDLQQPKTVERAFISATVDQTVSQGSYVALSRTRHELKIFAEDADFSWLKPKRAMSSGNPVELLAPG